MGRNRRFENAMASAVVGMKSAADFRRPRTIRKLVFQCGILEQAAVHALNLQLLAGKLSVNY
jgi:hypothetical protein